jgi:pimeloyl-ACP methyl ester carboxylesterase
MEEMPSTRSTPGKPVATELRPKGRRRRLARTLLLILAACGIALGAWAYAEFRASRRPPTSRLAAGAHYAEMPPDDHHHYIDLPLDHANPGLGSFRDFYVLSPGFERGGPVVFFFTDGQMELVGTNPDMSFFEGQLPGLSYVLVGHRGHAPTLFPEVYPDGHVDLRRAMNLYGSWQRVEDLESVRRDMIEKGLLPEDGRIMIYGASGAGVLAQQYLHRYGTHVSRVLLSSTGAPDIARQRGADYARDFDELDPEAAQALGDVVASGDVERAELAYLLYQLGREGSRGRATQREVLHSLLQGEKGLYWRLRLQPRSNWTLARTALGSTAADAVKVRMFELTGHDLRRYAEAPRARPHLLYAWASEVLADYLSSGLALPDLELDRQGFEGEVLVVSGLDDVVFSPDMGKAIAQAYRNARFLAVRGGHRLDEDPVYHANLRRAFFLYGLDSPELKALLDAPPTGPAPAAK